jgi:hypothetical protein
MNGNIQNPRVLEWLLESDDPVVRYRALGNIYGANTDDVKVRTAKSQLLKSDKVLKIFAKQDSSGYWGDPNSPYLPKYKATYWNLILLAQMELKLSDLQIAKACEYIFQFQLEDGGFSIWNEISAEEYFKKEKKSQKQIGTIPDNEEWIRENIKSGELSCLTGNVCAALLRFGYVDDVRVQSALNWLVEIQHNDGGWKCPYWKTHLKDKHSCFMGTIAALEAFVEVPLDKRSQEMQVAIKRGAEFVLMHRLYKADHHKWRIIKPNFVTISFPWFYSYDFLRGLWVLTKFGYGFDARTQDAIDLLMEKRLPNGFWPLEKTPTGRMLVSFGPKGKPNKWATLLALEVLVGLGIVKI